MPRRRKCPDKLQKELEAAIGSAKTFQSTLSRLTSEGEDNVFHDFYKNYTETRDIIYETMQVAISKFSQQPLLMAFLAWAKEVQGYNQKKFENGSFTLIKEKLVPFFDNEGKFYSISSLRYLDHKDLINKIRARQDISLEAREALVDIYINFTYWLEQETFDYVSRAFDPDEMKIQGRSIRHSVFIQFLSKLEEKERLVAKLLYFGGSRTLDEVLSVDLKDVDFKNFTIRYGMQTIAYPSHIFSDIAHMTDRKSGRLFLGRQNAPLNPATIFRNFKEAGSQAGLGDSFSPKGLTTSV